MALCPKCKTSIKWNWCQDCFVYKDGEHLKTIKTDNENEDLEYTICICGQWIALTATNKDEGTLTIYECPEWEVQHIDWELEVNSF